MIYFLHPEGSAWIAAHFENNELKGVAYEADAATHQAANDMWAGIVPSDNDIVVEDCEDIVRQVMGEHVIPEMVVVTEPAPEYVLHMHDDGGSDHEVVFVEEPSQSEINNEIEDWVNGGEWGDGGACIDVGWTLEQDGEEIDSGFYEVEIEPNHSSLIAQTCKRDSRSCGNDPDDHDWTAEGEGGCTENPGVWSTGGTSMTFSTHCRKCGLHRTEYSTGSQKNPGEHDTVSYEMPENWCDECEQEECRYEYPRQYIRYTDCDDEIPAGEELESFIHFEDAEEFAKKYAHENNVKRPDLICIALDDTEDGDNDYHVFVY